MNYEKLALVANSIDSAIRENSAIKSFLLETSSATLDDQTGEKSQSIQDFLDAPLGDKREMIMKKAYAAAMIVAKEKGAISSLPENASEIAALVDEGLVRVKANYQVGIGMLDPESAIDNIIDHAESRAIAFVDKVFDSGVVTNTVTEGLVRVAYSIPEIGPVVGPVVENYKPIIKSVVAKVEPVVRNAIKTGIHTVANTAKKVARVVVEKAKSWAMNTAKKLASFFA